MLLSTENPAEENHALCRKISSQMALQLNKLYHMYEFSDRFQLFSREECFGGIFNFVDMGILTKRGGIFCSVSLNGQEEFAQRFSGKWINQVKRNGMKIIYG